MIKSQQKSNKKEIKKYKSFLKKYIKWNWRLFSLFLFDILLFSTIIIVSLITSIAKNIKPSVINGLKYFILISSFYILLKFTITNFFFTSIYYKNLIVFDKEFIINKTKLHFLKRVDFISLTFLVIFILMNIIVAVILTYQSNTLFKDQEIIKALVITLISLLLIPSFVTSLNKICNIKQISNTNYKNLIRNQFLANQDIFKEYQTINNFEYIEIKELQVKSKKGIFLLTSYPKSETNKKTLEINNTIIGEYNLIWKKYCEYLSLINKTNLKSSTKYLNYYIQRIFDLIFMDFFDF